MVKNTVIKKNLKRFIEEKAYKEDGFKILKYVSTCIKQLTNHLEGISTLSKNEIEKKLSHLIGCMTLTLDQPIDDLKFLRARRCTQAEFTNISELSYIKKTSNSFPEIGRLNRPGCPLFYASVIRTFSDKALMVVLSEVEAKNLDRIYILRSKQKKDQSLNLRMIGIWDSIRLNHKPLFMPNNVYLYYQDVYKMMVSEFDSQLLMAYQLADRFLADIMSKKNYKNLYDITSIASVILLDDKNTKTKIDGIIYTSVEAKNEPVIVIKPTAVDNKLNHDFVTEVIINKHYGYEFYNYKTTKKFNINKSTGKLELTA